MSESAGLVELLRPPGPEPKILVLVGSRLTRWDDPDAARKIIFKFLDGEPVRALFNTIMSGESDQGGVDAWVKEWAGARGYSLPDDPGYEHAERKYVGVPPDFERYGKPNAYRLRNQEMAERGHQVWALLAPSAPLRRSGSMQTLRMARKLGKPTRAYRITSRGVMRLGVESKGGED